MRFQVEHMVDLDVPFGDAVVGDVADPDELVGVGKGERPQEKRVDDAEDGGAGSDAESGDEDSEDGEAGVALEGAEGVA